MSCNLAQRRADNRERERKWNELKKKKNNTNTFKPKPKICKYCKETGHVVGYYDKTACVYVTVCPKAIAKNARKAATKSAAKNAVKTKQTQWKAEIVAAVATETGIDGWDAVGTSDKTRSATKSQTCIRLATNPFDMGDDSDEDTSIPETAPAPAKYTSPTGAWATGPPSDSLLGVEESKGECWGDMSD